MDFWIVYPRYREQLRTPTQRLFATPFQADTFANEVRCSQMYTYHVRPATWQEREAIMFLPVEGEEPIYKKPVWHREAWWDQVAHYFKDMFVHISLADPDTVAFTEDARKGEADRQTLMKPGKFLQKFLGDGGDGSIEHGPLKGWMPQVTKQQIAYYAEWHKIGERPQSEDELLFAETADEIARVYEEGPDSCMKKGWDLSTHPTRVYAGGGLALAYLQSVSGDVVARALCWPANEVFGRVYPTPNNDEEGRLQAELEARLKAKGWQSIKENSSVFEGALLSRIKGRNGHGWGMPYLDNEYGVEEVHRDGKAWWRMTHEEGHQDSTDGFHTESDHEDEDRWTCDECGDDYDEDYEDRNSVYGSWRARIGSHRGGFPQGEMVWCNSCLSNNASYCAGSEEYYSYNEADFIEVNHESYERNWAQAQGVWQDSYDEAYYFLAEDTPVRMGDGNLIHADYLDDRSVTFRCGATGIWWPVDFESDPVPGYHCEYDDWEVHPIEEERVVPVIPYEPQDVEAWAKAHGDTPALAPAAQADLFIPAPVEDVRYPEPVARWDENLRQFIASAEIVMIDDLAAMPAHLNHVV